MPNEMFERISMQVHLLVFLPAIFLVALHSKAGKPVEPVYDTEGNELNPSEVYYILPSNHSRPGGGLILTQHNTSWPLFVAHDISQPGNGNPVTITPVTNNLPGEQVVSVSSNVHIQFVSCGVSMKSMLWKIGGREGASGRRHVVADGIRGDPGSTKGQFRIEKGGTGGYRIFFCPKVCKLCRSACETVDVFIEPGKRWLGLEGLPLTVTFKKRNLPCFV
jgi:Trypsin and protease inhibitor